MRHRDCRRTTAVRAGRAGRDHAVESGRDVADPLVGGATDLGAGCAASRAREVHDQGAGEAGCAGADAPHAGGAAVPRDRPGVEGAMSGPSTAGRDDVVMAWTVVGLVGAVEAAL